MMKRTATTLQGRADLLPPAAASSETLRFVPGSVHHVPASNLRAIPASGGRERMQWLHVDRVD